MKTSRIFYLTLLVAATGFSLQAQTDSQVDGVTVKDQQVYAMRGDKLELLADNLKFPFAVEVITNGCFTVGQGKVRTLQAGQILRRDGWLLHPDGSVAPVFNHVTMQGGVVKVVRDGVAAPLVQPMNFTNGLSLAPDGACAYPDGAHTRLMDGQLFRLDGTPVAAKDTITLKMAAWWCKRKAR